MKEEVDVSSHYLGFFLRHQYFKSKRIKLGSLDKLNLPESCALGGKWTVRKNLLNKLLLCICMYVSLLSFTCNWVVKMEDRKSAYEICEMLSHLTHLLFRAASHIWSTTWDPGSFFNCLLCWHSLADLNWVCWPKLGSADQMLQIHRVLERGPSSVLEQDMCL